MAVATQDDLLEAIDKMTVLELSEFIKRFEERYGVTAAVAVAAPAAPAAGGGAAEGAAAAATGAAAVTPYRSSKRLMNSDSSRTVILSMASSRSSCVRTAISVLLVGCAGQRPGADSVDGMGS